MADGVLFMDGFVLDEKNMPGDTLGIRRIQCRRTDLWPLKRAMLDYPTMLHARGKAFIDAAGTPFLYIKTVSSKLSAYKIKSVEKKESASLLWLHGVHFPITIPRPPLNDPRYARMLHIGDNPWVLYDYVSQPVKDTYRRV